jgi:CRP-like cAMP-binding protein
MSLIERHLQAVQLLPAIPFHQQDLPLDCVYFAEDGVLSLLAITPAGESIEVASAGRSGAIWPILESGLPHGYLTAVAPGPVQASRIDVALLQAILSESGPLNQAFDACREALVL